MTTKLESVIELHTYLAAFRQLRHHLVEVRYSLSTAVGETEAALEKLSAALTEYNQVPVPAQFASVHHLARQAAVAQEAGLERLVQVLRIRDGQHKVGAAHEAMLANRAAHHLANAGRLLSEALNEFQLQLLELDASVITRAMSEFNADEFTT